MTALIPTIEPLVTRLGAFTRDRRCKLLHVRVGVELRAATVELVRAHEHRLENRSPFVVLEQDHLEDDAGWDARVEDARRVHEARRIDADPPIPALAPFPGGSGVAAFALQVQQLLHAAPPGTSGLVVVLAPRRLESAALWRDAVEMLVTRASLSAVRWIVVEAESHSLAVLVDELGERADACDVRVPGDVAISALADLASGRGPAGPRGVVPPPRRDVPSTAPDAEGEKRLALRGLVLTAALATSRKRPTEAIAAQRAARDLCEGAGWRDEATTMELVLGSQLVAAGAVREAENTFLHAIERARAAGRDDQVSTAGFGLGATRTLRGERHTALVAYAEAAVAAETSGSPALAIEGARLAGQAALDVKMEPQAIAFLGRAVRIAVETPEDVSRTSAPTAARMLASICRKRSMPARAAELEAQAQSLAKGRPVVLEVARPIEVPRVELPSPSAAASIEEGTAILTLEEIARVHWGGVVDDAAPPEDGSRSWTRGEIEMLQGAVDRSLDDDSSAMLAPEELAALRGQSVVHELPALIEEVEPEAPPPLEAPPLPEAPSHADEDAALAAALAQLMAQGEGRMVMRREDLELIRKKLLEREGKG
jgi:hypothetical protein